MTLNSCAVCLHGGCMVSLQTGKTLGNHWTDVQCVHERMFSDRLEHELAPNCRRSKPTLEKAAR